MANPKGNPNIVEYGKNTRFGTERGCNPAEAADLSNKSQAASKAVFDLTAEGLDFAKAAKAMQEGLENGDWRAWQIWLDYTMPKAAQKIEADITQNVIRVSIDDD